MISSRTSAIVALGASAVLVAGCGSSPGPSTTAATTLAAALVSTHELPGFTVTAGQDVAGPTVPPTASLDCEDLGAIVFAASTPGSLAHAKVDLKRGDQVGNEQIADMGTPAAAAQLVDGFKNSAAVCPIFSGIADDLTLTFRIKLGAGQGGGAHDFSYVLIGLGAAAGTNYFVTFTVVDHIVVQCILTQGGSAAKVSAINTVALAHAKAKLQLK